MHCITIALIIKCGCRIKVSDSYLRSHEHHISSMQEHKTKISWQKNTHSYQKSSETPTNQNYDFENALEGEIPARMAFTFMRKSLKKQQYKRAENFITYLNSVKTSRRLLYAPVGISYQSLFSVTWNIYFNMTINCVALWVCSLLCCAGGHREFSPQSSWSIIPLSIWQSQLSTSAGVSCSTSVGFPVIEPLFELLKVWTLSWK